MNPAEMDTVEGIGDTLALMASDGEVLETHRVKGRREAKRVVLDWVARYTVRYAEAMRVV